ncbi:molybdate ABC transporter substrate-binding protein [Celeribacter neptunius]|uniref:Molybdate-binding protein ModA n=1 Tax=Celeribacter neptunius TaxID=588602 RepID=A0A1I3M058_9RHOB|nr:molybdate ABC transporter substrate-binding protein [Celeribacter neptunius]SFI90368.1 molybdate transport system substrate-binding protein [Celeribacter neptunius]
MLSCLMPPLATRCVAPLHLAATLVATFALPAALHADQVTVFAAASMTNALAAIEAGFEAETGHDLAISLAGSSALARQIQQGAPADVFISANPGWMDTLEEEGLLAEATRRDLVTNAIVLVQHGQEAAPMEIDSLPEALGEDRLAMALVDAVPAGIYGKASLESLGLWDSLAPHVAQADNVRAALALVALGEAPFGIVYATDAAAEERVSVVATFPEESHPPIVYPVAMLAEHDTEAARAFMTYLDGDTARAALEAEGFVIATQD